MSKILAVTCNPSFDKTLLVDIFKPGTEMRVREWRMVPGGKGVNVARGLQALGVSVHALTLCDALPVLPRMNTTIMDAKGVSTRVLEPGPLLDRAQVQKFEAFLKGALQDVNAIVLSGSLPPGMPSDFYARIMKEAQKRHVMTVLDTSGAALTKGLKAGPFIVKPNRDEAEAICGFSLSSDAAVKKALQYFTGRGKNIVLLSLGESGLVGFDGSRIFKARGPVISKGLTVGCGDAALAGFLAGYFKGDAFEDCLRLAVACGAANVGAKMPGAVDTKVVLKFMKQIRINRV
ncbi:MAG: 1-phosphofructokinase family hexose kinase [Candidatus Omnitrophica bacterium]|nr:1-phosphofructokinase family hexose kinase [Candidatus Omnitrophota bacterium]